MYVRFVDIAAIFFGFLPACSMTHQSVEQCDQFDRVIDANVRKMPNAKEQVELVCEDINASAQPTLQNKGEQKFPSPDLAFFANNKDGCSPDSAKGCPYALEAKHLNHAWPPKFGLSLSGGGTRAASFSIGVMKALKEAKKLDQIELISSVSGGSYANYWYFSQMFYKDRLKKYKLADTDIFKTWEETTTNLDDPDLYRFQRTLEESSEILGYAHKPSFTKDIRVGMQYGVETLIQGFSTPIHWLANGLFDWEANITPYYYFYKDGLDRTYGYVPLDYTLDNFANATPGFFRLANNIDAEPILLKDMKAFLFQKKKDKQQLPYFIINTTARFGRLYGRDGRDGDRLMENNVMEFTPWGCHSELLDFHPSDLEKNSCPLQDFHVEFNRSMGTMELDLARIITISGAAVDGQTQFVDISGREEKAYQLFGKTWLDLGLETFNLNLGYTSQIQDTPLWQRIFHKLLPWPLYHAHDYLLSQGEKDTATSVHLSDGGHSENLGLLPLLRRGTECIVAVDSEYDPDSVFESAKRLNQTLARHGYKFKPINDESSEGKNLINVHDLNDDLLNAVTMWEVVKQQDNKSLDKPIKIIYIKLSAPSKFKNASNLPYSITSYLKENPDFPHESTVDIAYSSAQFRAYRDLGYTIAKDVFSGHKGCLFQ